MHTLIFGIIAMSIAIIGESTTPDPADVPGHGEGEVVQPEMIPALWDEIEGLINEQKFERASEKVATVRLSARAAGMDEHWTKALVKETQLRMALHGYETAVRFLKDEPWPKEPLWNATLNLFYAQALTTYIDMYSWEINQREKVLSSGEVDLRAWTHEEIYQEAVGAYLTVWGIRDRLGDQSVSVLDEYLEPNTYPEEIRGTLRDAVTYLFVGLLANTTHWRPEHTNEIYMLDLELLLGGDLGEPTHDTLADPAVHPLKKVCMVLDDLEAWAWKENRIAGALEARLERLRRLWGSFTDSADRIIIRDDLKARLPDFRDNPWWAEGMAQLAQFVKEEDDPDSYVRAHGIAEQGYEAFPESIGGKHCFSIMKGIEAPSYSMTAMESDGIGKRSVEIRHKNLESLYFRAYEIDLLGLISSAKDWNLFPQGKEIITLMGKQAPALAWSVDLPPTPDYREHRTFVTPPLDEHGCYIIVSSANEAFSGEDNRLLAAPVIFTDLVLLARSDGAGGHEARVVRGSTGTPVYGARVTLYQRDWQHGHHALEQRTTDENGLVRFATRDEGRQSGHKFLLAQHDGDLTLDDTSLWFREAPRPHETTASLIYTDRSVYRPQQEILWKVVVYRGRHDLGRFATLPDVPVSISLIDPNSQTVETATVSTNSYGSASGSFIVPAGRPLGSWRLESSQGGRQSVRVEEYKRPTFEASFRESKEPLRLNKPATFTGEVRYYFGLPVVNGSVTWRVTREPVFPYWWFWWRGGATARSQTVAAGTTNLTEDGTFQITFTPEADEQLAQTSKETSYRFVLSASVTDEGGETRHASRSFRLGFRAVEARVNMATGFVMEDSPVELTINRTNLDGVGRAGKGRWELSSLKEPKNTLLPVDEPLLSMPGGVKEEAYTTPGDTLRPRWDTSYTPERTMRGWPPRKELENGKVEHNEAGMATVKLGALPPGPYRFTYRTVDEFGEEFETSHEFLVVAPEASVKLPAVFRVESGSVPVGGTARVVALSGLPDQLLFLDIFRAGKIAERLVIEAGTDAQLIEIPVSEEDRGGFGLTLTAVRDHQFMQFSQAVYVPWDNKDLTVSFATFRDKIRPGSRETWTVTVKGPDGTAVDRGAAELLAYMYDKSLDIFAPHSPPNPRSLYPSRTGVTRSRSTLGSVAGRAFDRSRFAPVPGYPSLIGDRLKFYSGYGIGGPGRRGMYREKALPMAAPQSADAMAVLAEGFNAEYKGAAHDVGDAVADEAALSPRAEETGGEAPAEALRSDFAETAFWEPHLLLGPDGSASIQFDVPDPLTSWNVWVHAVTTDLKAGSLHRETASAKELMVRPYVPRFLREGDEADITVVVNNAADRTLKGTLELDIIDPETNENLLEEFGITGSKAARAPFEVKPQGGTNLSFPITTPKRVGMVAFRVVAKAENLSDGELRPLPILPSRVHLVQSRFVTLRNKDRRVLRFEDLAEGIDSTRVNDQMVITVDAQLFYTVLQALPYLINYPYECTEQTLNRFVSTGIVSALYDDYPAIARMAEEFSKRETRFETFDEADPNRRMALEETPWLEMAKGGREDADDLVNVLDPRIAEANRDAAIAKLAKAQTSLGGFPWFPGGPPSPYMTLYIMHGFAKAMEFGVSVPEDMVRRGWDYLAKHYRDTVEEMMAKDCCWEFLTFLNYVASCYDDVSWTGDMLTADERVSILDFSFKHWKSHSPYLKGYLALTLKRMDREEDAELVWESVMDAAKTTDDQGTFWAPEDRAWLWYNDTIETHAFALRTLSELEPLDSRRDGLVQWLLLNKKLNHWKSTKATAEVIYSLVHYLEAEGALGITEDATVTVGNRTVTFTFEPDSYTGKKNQIVVPGEQVGPETAEIVVEKESKGFAFASATWHFSTEELPEEERGDFFNVSRRYFKREHTGREYVLRPLEEGEVIAVGDQIEVQISLRSKHRAEYVHLRDPRAAGLEPENQVSRYRWDLGISWYEETRDSGSNFFFESLPVGEYTFKYRLRATMAGTFRVGPATVQSMYAPEFNAYSSGAMIAIAPAE